jgi:glycerol-3-phosphate dehydrogenase (NAD(P)+)
MRRVGVLGAGSWGTTFASLLCEQAETRLWAREAEVVDAVNQRHENPLFLAGVELPASLAATGSLSEAVADAELVVVAVPAQFIGGIAAAFAELVPTEVPLLSLAKGIEIGSLRRPTEVLVDALPRHDHARVGVLSGPNLAREIAAGQPAATVVAMADQPSAERIQALLSSDRFRVYTSTDVVGCEIGGAVKNVIALAAGMVDGLGHGWNSRAALITRGLAELTRLGVALGGDPLTFLGLAGNGDLIATCCSEQSRNRTVGVALGEGTTIDEVLASMEMVAEGVRSAPAVLALADRHGIEMPITAEVVAAIEGRRTPAEVVTSLMRRMPTSELHDLPR